MISRVKLRVPVSDRDHSAGRKDAPFELVEYGDFECPFCGQAYWMVKRLQETLKDDLRFIYRNFPLTQTHPNAMNAARAAESAVYQQKFWQMHDTLFENQKKLDEESFLKYASELDLNVEKFVSDMNSREVEERISFDIEGGIRSGVNGTPTLYINGYRYDGDRSLETLLDVFRAMEKDTFREVS